jgi:7-cyano-7-deazaguanine synthase
MVNSLGLKMKKAIVLISGGMDSAVCAGLATEQGYEIFGLHINYGQRTEKRELKAFNNICDYYNAKDRLVVDISHLVSIGGSSLTDKNMLVSKANLESKEIPSSYVPFRNANILAIATSWAEVISAGAIFIGAMEEDSSGYPDCRKVFFQAFQDTINTGTKPETQINIETPIIDISKKDIIIQGSKIGVPFHLSWSCYQNEEEACGECDSCALRLRGFSQANITDPIKYVGNG